MRTRPIVLALMVSLCAQGAWGDSAEDQFAVAAAHYSAARWELAVEEFTTFLDAYPDHRRCDDVTFFLAESLVQVGRLEEAQARFREYVRKHPSGTHARRADFRVGETMYLSGKHADARADLQRFRQAYPDDELCTYVLAYLGEISLALEDAEAAKEAFAEGLKRYPDGPLVNECRYGLARTLEKLGDDEAAMRFYRFLGEQGTGSIFSDDALLRLAILQYHQGQFVQAVQTLRAHVERFPGSELATHAQYWLGMSLLACGDFSAAAQTLEQAAERFATHELAPAMTFSAADAYRRAGEFSKIEPLCERVLRQWPESDWADDSLQTLVELAWEEDRADRVRSLADRFASEYPNSALAPRVQQMLSRAEIKTGRFDAAIEVLEPLVEKSVQSPESTDSPEASAGAGPGAAVSSTPSPSPGAHVLAANTYYLALAYLGAHRHQEALTLLEQLATVDEPAELADGVHVARASALIGLERFADAVEPLQAYLRSPTRGADVDRCRAQLAVALAHQDRWNEVESVVAELRASHTDNDLYLSTIEYLAERGSRQNQMALAETLFGFLAQEDSAPQYAARGLAGLAWLQGQRRDGVEAAAATFARLLQQFPESPLVAEAAIVCGQSLEQAGHSTQALEMYRVVVDRYKSSPEASAAMLSAARICDRLQQDSEAELLLRNWLEMFPAADQRDAALYQLAWVLVDLERDDDADLVFEQLYREHRTGAYWADATYRLAERAVGAKDFARAEGLAAEIVDAQTPGRMTSYALFLRGQLAATAQRWQDVLQWMGRLLAEYPDTELKLPAEYWLAESHYRLRHYAQAGVLFDQLQRATAGRDDTWLAMIPLRRAQVRAHAGAWDEAYAIARPIAKQFPHGAQLHEVDYLLGRYYMNRGEFDEAREAYQSAAVSTTGANTETAAMAQWMIGETYFMQREYNQAIKAYHRVEVLHSFPQWQAVALLQAGKCHEMLSQWDQATKLYTQILRVYPSTRVAEKATLRLRMARQRAETVRTR
ncbi:MAG: tetratricopeptide repeat protein [Pirellulaceae bacterium]